MHHLYVASYSISLAQAEYSLYPERDEKWNVGQAHHTFKPTRGQV